MPQRHFHQKMPLNSPPNYGSLPSSTSTSTTPTPSLPKPFLSRARAQISTRRPWREFFDISAISLPYSYAESIDRLRRNTNYFRINYALVMHFILFCSLIYDPVSMIVFLIIFVLWLSFIFFRDDPVVVFGKPIGDRVVMALLGLLTVIALAFTDVGTNVFVALLVGVVVVGFHAALRGVEDLFLDEDQAAEGGLLSVVGGGVPRPPPSYSLN